MIRRDHFVVLIGFIFYAAFGLYLFMMPGVSLSSNGKVLFLLLMAGYVWLGLLFVWARVRFELSILEPMFFAFLLYYLIFIIKPILDLKAGEMYSHGIYVLTGGKRAAVYFLFAFTAFFCGYYSRRDVAMIAPEEGDDPEQEWNPTMLYGAWILLYVLCLISMFSQGLSLRYILSLGTEGNAAQNENSIALMFLANFAVTLLAVWLVILFKTHAVLPKVIITLLTIIYLLMRNGRWLILAFALSPVLYYYLKKRKQPKLVSLLIMSLFLLIIFAWMQYNRRFLASGSGMRGFGEMGFSLDALLAPFESDLGTYKTFYSMVTRFPRVYPYMKGKTFLYVFILFVPRVLWPSKPDNPVRDMITQSLNKQARLSGTAVANIGEIYANFGFVGCFVLMFFFGRILAGMKKLYLKPTDDRLLMYSILYPLLFQWIARGNFSGNFYMTLFAVLPFAIRWLVKYSYERSMA